MKGQTRLRSEEKDGKKRPTLFFILILGFLASTSWVYGSVYLRPLWSLLIGGLPLSPAALNALYTILGGGSGVLLTTFATNRWNAAKLYAATTGKQFTYAWWGELVSFTADLIFSVIGLLTLIGGNMSNDLRVALEWAAVFSFIGLTVIHAILHRLFVSADKDVWQRRTETLLDGLRTSEQLIYQETVSRDGLLIASQQATDAAPGYADRLGQQWRDELLDALPVRDTVRPKLPPPPANDWTVVVAGETVAERGDQQTAIEAARRMARQRNLPATIYHKRVQVEVVYPPNDDVIIHPHSNGAAGDAAPFGRNGRQ